MKCEKMKNKSDIAIENINQGDIYYFKLNNKYFFLQILKIVTDLPAPYDIDFKYGYYLAIFQKTFKGLPTIGELDLSNIYIKKHYLKNESCYYSLWNTEPNIRFEKHLMHYDLKNKYEFIKFGNRSVKKLNNFKPPLIPQFSMPAKAKYHNGIQNTHSPASIQHILISLESEEKQRTEKKKTIKALYFKEWLEYINGEAILKTEKAILQFQQKEGRIKTKENALKKCVENINKVDLKHSHIGTIEREDLFDKLIEISKTKEIEFLNAEIIINENRDW